MTRLHHTEAKALMGKYHNPIIVSEGGLSLEQAEDVASFIGMVMSTSIHNVRAIETTVPGRKPSSKVTCVYIVGEVTLNGTEDRHQIAALINRIEQDVKAIVWTYKTSGQLVLA